jgi:hypothetical protein
MKQLDPDYDDIPEDLPEDDDDDDHPSLTPAQRNPSLVTER